MTGWVDWQKTAIKEMIYTRHLKAATERVRELHQPEPSLIYSWETGEFSEGCTECIEAYPCNTIKALEGKDEYTK